MSKLETPMVLKYWQQIGGTLIEEFPMVRASATCGPRYADAVIVPRGEERRITGSDRAAILLEGQEVIVVQAKGKPFGYVPDGPDPLLAGLIRRFNPASVRSVALCTQDDSVPLAAFPPYPHVEVVVMAEFSSRTPRDSPGSCR